MKKIDSVPAKDYTDPQVRYRYGRFCGLLGIFFNLFLFAGKMVVGLLSASVSICADAVNNLTDAASSVVSLLGFRLSRRPPDEEHPYGHGRYEYLSGLVVCFLIFFIGIEVLTAGVDKILHPAQTAFSYVTVAILLAAVLCKVVLACINYKIGRAIDSQSLVATAQDSRNDVISTLAVLLAMILSHFTGYDLDGYIGVMVALFILYSGFGLLKETIYPLLGAAPDPAFVAEIRKTILSYEGVLGTHDLMVHDYGPGRRFASVHVEMAAEADVLHAHDVIDNIEQFFLKEKNLHLVIHYDPIITEDHAVSDLRLQLMALVQKIDPQMSVHDLRVVRGPTHTNLVFDCVIPHSLAQKTKQLKEEIVQAVTAWDPTYRCVIVFEHNFAAIPHK